jgi:hypothetical protein
LKEPSESFWSPGKKKRKELNTRRYILYSTPGLLFVVLVGNIFGDSEWNIKNKIQKAIWVGPWPFFIYLRPDRSTDICCWPVFPFYPAGNIVSRARPGNITTADPRCDCLFFLLSISIFFPSSTDKCCCCWCDFLLSV